MYAFLSKRYVDYYITSVAAPCHDVDIVSEKIPEITCRLAFPERYPQTVSRQNDGAGQHGGLP